MVFTYGNKSESNTTSYGYPVDGLLTRGYEALADTKLTGGIGGYDGGMAGLNKNQVTGYDLSGATAGQFGRDFSKDILLAGNRGLTAQGYGAPVGTAAQLGANDYKQFMNPFQNDVIDQVIGRMGTQRDTALTMADARAANGTAFGGSGAALERAQINRQHEQGVGEMEANLRAQAFDRANALASQNVDREQQMGLTNLTLQDAAARYGADATNNMAQFGAGQGLNAAIAAGSAYDTMSNRDQQIIEGLLSSGAGRLAYDQAVKDQPFTSWQKFMSSLPTPGATQTTNQPLTFDPFAAILGVGSRLLGF